MNNKVVRVLKNKQNKQSEIQPNEKKKKNLEYHVNNELKNNRSFNEKKSNDLKKEDKRNDLNKNNKYNLIYYARFSEEKIRLTKLNLLKKYDLLNQEINKEKYKDEFSYLFYCFIIQLLIVSFNKYKKNLNNINLKKKKNSRYLLKVKKLNLYGKIETIIKLNNKIRILKKKTLNALNKNKKFDFFNVKKNFKNLLKKKKMFDFFFLQKKKLNFKIFNEIYTNKIYYFFFFYLLKKFKLYEYKTKNSFFHKKKKYLLYKQKNELLKNVINELNLFFFQKIKKNKNNLKKFRHFYYKYVLFKNKSLNFLNYLKLKKIYFFFIKNKNIKKKNNDLCKNRFMIQSFEDENKFVLFPSFIERYYYFGFQKKTIRLYKLTKNFFSYFNDIKKIRSFFFFNTNISILFNQGNDTFPTFWTKRKEFSFFWRFFFYLITKWFIFFYYSLMYNCNFMFFKNRNYLKLIYINSAFFFELHNIVYDRFSFNFISFIKNNFNFFKLRKKKKNLIYNLTYPDLSYFLFENLLFRKKYGFLFLLYNKKIDNKANYFSFMRFFNDFFLYTVPKKVSEKNFFKKILTNIDNEENQFNLNDKNEIFNNMNENKIKKKTNKFFFLKKKENEVDEEYNDTQSSFNFDRKKLFIYENKILKNTKKIALFSSNLFNKTMFINGISKKKVINNENSLLYLQKILLELGVHLGTEINGRGRFMSGYNEIMNYYLLGFFKIKNMELMDYKLYLKKISFIPSILKKGFLFYQTLKYPIINIMSTIFILKQAMIFILSLGKKGGRMLFSHSEITKNPGFVLFLSGISNLFGHSFNFMPWIFGAGSNYSHMIRYFFDNFFYHGTILRQKIKGTSFISFFFRVLFLNCFLVPKDLLFSMHEKKTFFFWKTIIFFRYFSHYFWAPDVVIGLNPHGGFNAVTEYGSHRMANISAVDTDGNFKGIAYAIPSNDDSLSIAAFYFNLFINAYEKGRLSRFHSNFSDLIF